MQSATVCVKSLSVHHLTTVSVPARPTPCTPNIRYLNIVYQLRPGLQECRIAQTAREEAFALANHGP